MPTEAELRQRSAEDLARRHREEDKRRGIVNDNSGFYPVDKAGNELGPTAATQAATIASGQTETPTKTSRSSSVSVRTRVDTAPPPTLPAATEAEKAAMQKIPLRVVDPFDDNFTKSFIQAIQAEGQAVQNAGTVLDRVQEEVQTANSGVLKDMQTLVTVKENINKQVAEQFKTLEASRADSWERQSAIVEQKKKIERMNPLTQAIRSMFDPNFNRRALNAELAIEKNLDAEEVRIFQERTQSARYLAELAAANLEDKSKLAELITRNGGQDFQFAIQMLNLRGAEVQNITDMLGMDAQIERAKAVAIDRTLTNMTGGQVSHAIEQAAKSPEGIAMVNGVPVPLGALQEQEGKIIERGLRIKQIGLAIQVTDRELVEFNKKGLMETFGREDLRKIIADGGMYEGIQFDIVQLGDRLKNLDAAEGEFANDAGLEVAEKTSLDVINGMIIGGNRAVNQRFESLMGSAPGEFKDFLGQTSAALKDYAAAGRLAKERGIGPKYFQDNMPTLQAIVAGRSKVIETAVNRWAGNNPTLKAFGMAWMTGQQVDPGIAARTLVHFARNGAPAGAGFTGDARLLLDIARDVVQRETQGSNTAESNATIDSIIAGNKSAGSKGEREQAIVDKVLAEASNIYRNTVQGQANSLLPRIAKEKGLAFGQIGEDQWERVVASGDAIGYANTATRLNGMDSATFKRMLKEGPKGQVWQQVSPNLQGEQRDFSWWQATASAAQMQAIFGLLDSQFSTPDFDAPAALREAVIQPQYLSELRKGVEASGNTTIGGFIASAISGTSEIMEDASAQQGAWKQAYAAYTATKQAAQTRAIKDRAGNPIVRTQHILLAAGATEDDVALITNTIKTRYGKELSTAAGATGVNRSRELNEKIDAFITGGLVVDNPELEAALKRVRSQYGKLATPMTRSFERFGGN